MDTIKITVEVPAKLEWNVTTAGKGSSARTVSLDMSNVGPDWLSFSLPYGLKQKINHITDKLADVESGGKYAVVTGLIEDIETGTPLADVSAKSGGSAKKPETPEERLERYALEIAKDAWRDIVHAEGTARGETRKLFKYHRDSQWLALLGTFDGNSFTWDDAAIRALFPILKDNFKRDVTAEARKRVKAEGEAATDDSASDALKAAMAALKAAAKS